MKTLTPEQKGAFIEITKLAMEIQNSKMSFNIAAECISVFDFIELGKSEYKYNFDCYGFENGTEKLDQLIDSLTSYIKENGTTA